uniref:Uncharacterized protein n=1 Tax=Arundo donax TaxID=35708 RepID=A0A0A9BPT3_ARUDO
MYTVTNHQVSEEKTANHVRRNVSGNDESSGQFLHHPKPQRRWHGSSDLDRSGRGTKAGTENKPAQVFSLVSL